MCFESVYVVHPYSSTDKATAEKIPILFYRIGQTSIDSSQRRGRISNRNETKRVGWANM